MPLPPVPCGQHVWDDFLANVRSSVDSRNYAAWFQGLKPKEINEAGVVAFAPSPFVKSLLERKFLPVLTDAARSCLGAKARVSIQFAPPTSGRTAPDRPDPDSLRKKTERSEEPAPERPGRLDVREPDAPASHLRLNKKYVFDHFVVGPSNELSHAACLQVVRGPACSYNPLFLHGASGLGKTHLLQATCRALIERDPALRVLYINCEEFINRFVDALNRGTLSSFRNRLRRLDCLAVDDIHFLANKKRMQEEFFHTFNTLYDSRKQIILSSDSRPQDMAHFEDRLRSRFQWGLMTSIERPGRETRQAIAEKKAGAHDRVLPVDVSGFLASVIKRNVRELEGAVIRLVATADLFGREIDLELARETLADLVPGSRLPLKPAVIASAVAASYGLKVSDLKSGRRARAVALPRQIAMHLIKSMTDCSLREIGAYFGGRDHTTVLNALNRVEALLRRDVAVLETVNRLRSELGGPSEL